MSYRVYTALLTQQGTNPPVATVLDNTIGDIQWSRVNAGRYDAVLVDAFPAGKTVTFLGGCQWDGNSQGNFAVMAALPSHPNSIRIVTYDLFLGSSSSAIASDELLSRTEIEIRVYP